MKKFKKFFVACTIGVTALLVSCSNEGNVETGGSTGNSSSDNKLVIWSFTDELEVQGDIQHFKNLYTGEGQKWEGYEVELSMIPTEDYLTKLLPVLESGKGSPDLFTGELDMVQNFIEAGYVADLETLINNDSDISIDLLNNDFVDYIIQSGRDENGVLRGISWQVTPGGVAVRVDLAVEIWGDEMNSDNVDLESTESVTKWLSDNKFNTIQALEISSKEVKEAGNYRLFVDDQSIRHYSTGSENHAWVIDNKLNPSKIEAHIEFMEVSKSFFGSSFDESLTANAAEWGGDWFSAISGPIQPIGVDGSYEVLAYSLPTWGLFHVLEPNMQINDENGNVIDEGTFGKWGMASGPNPYFWGGTYLVINEEKDDAKKELAFDFIKSMIFDDERLYERALETGDVFSRISIMDRVQDGYEGRESLNYQNHYEFFMSEADKIDFSHVTKYDRSLNTMIKTYTDSYVRGEKSLEQALNDFYSEVSIVYGDEMISSDLPYKN